MNRKDIANNTLEILKRGNVDVNGTFYDLKPDFERMLKGTKLFVGDEPGLEVALEHSLTTRVEVVNETALEAMARLAKDQRDDEIVCLNFASAKNPGGGFLGGAQAPCAEQLPRRAAFFRYVVTAAAGAGRLFSRAFERVRARGDRKYELF